MEGLDCAAPYEAARIVGEAVRTVHKEEAAKLTEFGVDLRSTPASCCAKSYKGRGRAPMGSAAWMANIMVTECM